MLNNMHKKFGLAHSHLGSPLGGELTVQNKHVPLAVLWELKRLRKQHLYELFLIPHVHCPLDVSPIILVRISAVQDLVACDLIIILALQESTQLWGQRSC